MIINKEYSPLIDLHALTVTDDDEELGLKGQVIAFRYRNEPWTVPRKYRWLFRLWRSKQSLIITNGDSIDAEDVEKANRYEYANMSRIDDFTVDLWGGAGPDCRTQPVQAGSS